MKKIPIFLMGIFASTVYASSIPYCAGTEVKGSKHEALQSVITAFAKENNCTIGTSHCIINFDSVKYAIAWEKDCPDSANRGNRPGGSTFVCAQGECYPLGFGYPSASYEETFTLFNPVTK